MRRDMQGSYSQSTNMEDFRRPQRGVDGRGRCFPCLFGEGKACWGGGPVYKVHEAYKCITIILTRIIIIMPLHVHPEVQQNQELSISPQGKCA